MSAGPNLAPQRPELVSEGPAAPRPRWLELALSPDHKDVGRLMIGASFGFLTIGLLVFLLMRLQLAIPLNDLIDPVTFDRLLSVWGPTMIMLFALPFAFGLFTYVVPLQIGARGTAFPRLGNLALWLVLLGGGALYASFPYTPPEAGVIPFPPLSDDLAFISTNGVDVWVSSVGLVTLGLLLQSINLLVTIARMRAPGLAWRRFPTFTVSAAVCSWLLVAVAPPLLAGLTMLEIDRHWDGVFFNAGEGGGPVYFQHLSWIFFTGAWALMVVFAIGVISDVLPTFAGKPLLSRGAVAGSMAAIAALAVLAWMQNMFTASIPIGWLYLSMAAALALVVPLGLVFFNWLATLFAAAIRFRAPMLFALGAISTLSFGLVSELIPSVIPVNWLLADTTDATAGTGYVLVGGPVLAGLAGLHHWFPKMTGRTMGEGLARVSLLLIVLGAHLTFIPMYLAGLEGQPADVFRFYDEGNLDAYNLISTIGAFVLSAGIVISIVNAILSVRGGASAGHDPWRGDSLEWMTLSPPPPHNFDVVPDVRSDEPMRDIREAVAERRAAEARPSTRSESEPAESGEPVA